MDIHAYFSLIKRWAWLLGLGLALSGALAYGFSVLQTPVYKTGTQLLVLRAPQGQNSDLAYLSSQQLAQTFIQLVKTQPVLQAAAAELGYPVYGKYISAEQVRDTQVLKLTVENESPTRAAEIANTLVAVLVRQNEEIQSSRYLENENALNAQIAQVSGQVAALQQQIDQLTTANVQEQLRQAEQKIASLQNEIAALESEIATATYNGRYPNLAPTEQTARLAQLKSTLGLYEEIYSNLLVLGKPTSSGASDRLAHLQKALELYQQIYLQLLGSLEEVRLARLQNTSSIVQIEAAEVPAAPVRPLPLRDGLLGAAVGLSLAGGLALLLEYLNTSLRTPEDVEIGLGLPVLGYITDMGKNSSGLAALSPRSQAAEAFRTLRANIDFSSATMPVKSLLITSSRSGDGKTTLAANLAIAYAQSSKRVLLVDGDLRRPSMHRKIGIPNRLGLTTLFRDSLPFEKVVKRWNINAGKEIRVLTAGSLFANPIELLSSERMMRLMAELRNQADMVIFDGPPLLVADAQMLASMMDGTLLVLQPGRSDAKEALAALTQLKRSGANVLGAVFNRIPRRGEEYYGGYAYYAGASYRKYAPSEPSNQAASGGIPVEIPLRSSSQGGR